MDVGCSLQGFGGPINRQINKVSVADGKTSMPFSMTSNVTNDNLMKTLDPRGGVEMVWMLETPRS